MQAQAQVMDGMKMDIGERIRAMMAEAERRGDKRITGTALAALAGIPRWELSRIKTGKQSATPEQVQAILRAMAELGYADPDEAAEPQPERAPAPCHSRTVGLCETQTFVDTLGWCESIRQRREIGVMYGRPGVGKTTTLKAYADRTPGAHLITCWRSMRMGDLLSEMADAVDVTLRGNIYRRTMQLRAALLVRRDVCYLLDEANQLKKWDTDKLETLRQLWDATGTPMILAGTHRLEEILRRWDGKDETTQLSSRMSPYEYRGLAEKEVRAILREYDLTADAVAELTRIAMDKDNGGMRNLVSVLGLCLEVAGNDRIDIEMVRHAARHKLPI